MTREQIEEWMRLSGADFPHIASLNRDLFPVFARFAEYAAKHEADRIADESRMIIDREIAQQAIEALSAGGLSAHATKKAREAAIIQLRNALADDRSTDTIREHDPSYVRNDDSI